MLKKIWANKTPASPYTESMGNPKNCNKEFKIPAWPKIDSKPKKLKLTYPNNLYLIHIPEKVFYWFKCVSNQKALIVNLISKTK